MPAPTRIGAVGYLNTRPLVHGLSEDADAGRIVLSYGSPAHLADRLAAGELDLALLPCIELARIPDLEVIPGLSISCPGPARSVLLVSKKPVREVGTVALDPESRTSNGLVQVLFDTVWKNKPVYLTGDRDLESSLAIADATVRIGDKALFEPVPSGLHVEDLSGIWAERTGLPFVFAVWAGRTGAVDRTLYRRLHACRRAGKQAIAEIARDYVWEGRARPEIAEAYLRENIRYRFGSRELQALNGFLEAAAGCGVIAAAPKLKLAFHRWTSCHDRAAATAAGRSST
ncbi:MAG: menaquinone biosynthesis protein [Acidobacteria bacterium]|uniref:Chorismate dehydratase n=1 Tax=Candidatus Polarisedimenticola svalbardensis TaxID=2886004 RepID=A0A8J6Y6X8_9BACT|nr:menaquinone biosynthesis protein [Candidatus Polarisedimenticola svalbardensis]